MSTSFFQYQFCTLCKVSHKQRKKRHVYSKRHQLVLQNVLLKFSKKIKDARNSTEDPSVHPVGWESGAQVWCYFCQSEVDKHQTREDCVVASAAFLTHLASQEHSQKMHTFFWDNLIPVDKKESFFVSSKELNRFMENAEPAVARFHKKEKERLVQETERIRAAEKHSREVAWMGRQQELVKSSLAKAGSVSCTSTSQQPSGNADSVPLGKKTAFAFGEGLTCITFAQGQEENSGNIYTGATPPWLVEEEDAKGGEIGPTAETFTKHLKALKKQKLPACRVGATFNHKVDTTSQWLPAFGRVWNHGRRLNSQNQFLKESLSKNPSVHGAVHRKARATVSLQASQSQPPLLKGSTAEAWRARQSWATLQPDGSQGLKEAPSGTGVQETGWAATSYSNGGHDVKDSHLLGSYQHPFTFHTPSTQTSASCSYASSRSLGTHSDGLHVSEVDGISAERVSFPVETAVQRQRPDDGEMCHNSEMYQCGVMYQNGEIYQNGEMYQGVAVDVESPAVGQQEDVTIFDSCRPYKRRRVASSTHPCMNSGLIPITPALLSQPARKTPAKQS